MNEAVKTAVLATTEPFTVKDIVAATGVSETTTRKTITELVNEQLITPGEARGSFELVNKKTGKKVYKKNPDAIRLIRKNRFSKAELTVQSIDELLVKDPFSHKERVEAALGEDVAELDHDDEDDKWTTVCLTHGERTTSSHIIDAWWKATHPAFCGECKKVLPADVVKAAKNLPSQRAKKDEKGKAA